MLRAIFFETESVVLFLPLLIMISLNLLTYPLTIYRSVLRGLDLIDIEQKLFIGSDRTPRIDDAYSNALNEKSRMVVPVGGPKTAS